MIDELRALAIFGTAVESGSFRAAARVLGLSPSVVSHHISALEARLGAALLYRSTRRISLTSEGELLFASVQNMMAAASQGLDVIARRSAEPSGRLTLTMPSFFARSALIARIHEFNLMYPRISVEVMFSDAPLDLVKDGIDMALRIGDLKDSSLKSKKIAEFERQLLVSPQYLANRAMTVRSPNDLVDVAWIGFRHRPHHRTLTHKTLGSVTIPFTPRLVVDSVDALAQFAIAGAGFATPPSFLVKQALASGHLVEPLPSWTVSSLDVFAVWPANASNSSASIRFLRFLENGQTNLGEAY